MADYWTNDSTALSAANLHKGLVHSDFLTEMGVLAYRIAWVSGTTFAVTALGSTDTAASVTATWDGTDDKVTVDWSSISNFAFTSDLPAVFVSPELDTADYTTERSWPQAKAITITTAEMTWFTSAGAQVLTPDATMTGFIFIIGKRE